MSDFKIGDRVIIKHSPYITYHIVEVNDLKHEVQEFTRDNRIPNILFSTLKEKLDKILAE